MPRVKLQQGNIIRRAAERIFGRFGFELVRVSQPARGPIASEFIARRGIPSLEQITSSSSGIPGMLGEESGKMLYMLCVTQLLEGDVVEIGSWQGYSTSFLASAVRDSGNGRMVAIDHFRGNKGTENYYVVRQDDLGDLRANFQANMEQLGLWEYIDLFDMPNLDAAARLAGREVRFLFIDGDHTRQGVESDISLFFPLLMPGSIVVFDDFSDEAFGVIEAIDDLLNRKDVARILTYPNTLVMILA